MLQPELWEKGSRMTTLGNKFCMEKYNHLITWKDNESILELGIGDGGNSRISLWPYIPNNFKEFIGTDVSESMVEYVKEKVTHEKMKFMVLDFGSPNIPLEFEGRFDHIFSFIVLHWIRDLKQAFSNLYKMLKPGGEIFLIFFERSSADEIYDYLSKHPKWGKYGHEKLISPFHFHENPLGEYEKVLKESQFRDYHFEVENWNYTFPSEQAFEDMFFSINPVINKIPEEDVEEYKSLYIGKMKNNNLNWVTECENTGKKVFNSYLKLFILVAKKPDVQ
ncbi:juvenile hormone acid O-methyltransferase [Leptinotarsa decemlineata]|uniref:juvenile hormone acid O-methyltransferase n=1 Tax=Leptinotarsa decemlineata TaxID=7539 RepID=UPI003D30D42E